MKPASLIKLLPEVKALIAAADLDWAGHLPRVHLVGVVRGLVAAKLAQPY
jgi:hypothetical protein